MIFYLGTHNPGFVNIVNIPWFVSVTTILNRRSKLNGNWMLDSGGFTQISKYGQYKITEDEYLAVIDLQKPKVAFCQDWMCEPIMLKKTGLNVETHQYLTTLSYLSLSKKSDVIRPVLQGWETEDYVKHLREYKKTGVNMNQIFGVGTVCSRNGKPEIIRDILKAILSEEPHIKLHGFGIKTVSAVANQDLLYSSDSMAWSFSGRRMEKLCYNNCPVKNCANCMEFALLWRKNMLYQMKAGRG